MNINVLQQRQIDLGINTEKELSRLTDEEAQKGVNFQKTTEGMTQKELERQNKTFNEALKRILNSSGKDNIAIKAQQYVIKDHFPNFPNIEINIQNISDTQKMLFCFNMAWAKWDLNFDNYSFLNETVKSENWKEYKYINIHNLLKQGKTIWRDEIPYDVYHSYQKLIADEKKSEAARLYWNYFGEKMDNTLKFYNQAQWDWSNTTTFGSGVNNSVVNYMRESLDYWKNMVQWTRLLKFDTDKNIAELFITPRWKDIGRDWRWWGRVTFDVGGKKIVFEYNNDWFGTKDNLEWIDWMKFEKVGLGYKIEIDRNKIKNKDIYMITRAWKYAGGKGFDERTLETVAKNCELTALEMEPRMLSVESWFKISKSDLSAKTDWDIINMTDNLYFESLNPNNKNKLVELHISVWATTTQYDNLNEDYSNSIDKYKTDIEDLIKEPCALLALENFRTMNKTLEEIEFTNKDTYEFQLKSPYGKKTNASENMVNNLKQNANHISTERIKTHIDNLDWQIEESLAKEYKDGGKYVKYKEQHVRLIKARYLNVLHTAMKDPDIAQRIFNWDIVIKPEFTHNLGMEIRYDFKAKN